MYQKNIQLITRIKRNGMTIAESATIAGIGKQKFTSSLNGYTPPLSYTELKPLLDELTRREAEQSTAIIPRIEAFSEALRITADHLRAFCSDEAETVKRLALELLSDLARRRKQALEIAEAIREGGVV